MLTWCFNAEGLWLRSPVCVPDCGWFAAGRAGEPAAWLSFFFSLDWVIFSLLQFELNRSQGCGGSLVGGGLRGRSRHGWVCCAAPSSYLQAGNPAAELLNRSYLYKYFTGLRGMLRAEAEAFERRTKSGDVHVIFYDYSLCSPGLDGWWYSRVSLHSVFFL